MSWDREGVLLYATVALNKTKEQARVVLHSRFRIRNYRALGALSQKDCVGKQLSYY